MLLSNYIAIDIGTETIRIADTETGRVISEPNVLAVSSEDGMVAEIGLNAQEIMECVPGRYIGVNPVQNGMIADYNMLQVLLSELIRKKKRGFSFVQPKAITAVPAGLTAMQKKEIEDIVKSAGVRDVMLLDAPVAAAIGMGEDVSGTTAIMVVSVGAGVTEVAVICMDRLIGYKMIPYAGRAFDETIAQKIRSDLDIWVGGKITEFLKKKIGLCGGDSETVCGKNISTGLPMMGSISGNELSKAMEQPASKILDAVREVLYNIPEELLKDVQRGGILLAGGGSKLIGLSDMLTKRIGIRTRIAAHPENTVINGTLNAAVNLSGFKRIDEEVREEKGITV